MTLYLCRMRSGDRARLARAGDRISSAPNAVIDCRRSSDRLSGMKDHP
jgi:hypothetical protein